MEKQQKQQIVRPQEPQKQLAVYSKESTRQPGSLQVKAGGSDTFSPVFPAKTQFRCDSAAGVISLFNGVMEIVFICYKSSSRFGIVQKFIRQFSINLCSV